MDLSSGWFGGRPARATLQMDQAADLGFFGLALLPGDPALAIDLGDEPKSKPLKSLSAASWDSLQAPGSPGRQNDYAATDSQSFERVKAAVPGTLKSLRKSGAGTLILSAGIHEEVGSKERGERLLNRLRMGETALARDEAVEELVNLSAPASERQLEALARFLYLIHQQAPGLRLALQADPSPGGLLTPHTLGLLLSDPALNFVAYWHDVGIAEIRQALGLDAPGVWLDNYARNIVGVSLHDYAEGQDRLPPGMGKADLQLLAEYLPRNARRVLCIAPSFGAESLHQAKEVLAGFGLK